MSNLINKTKIDRQLDYNTKAIILQKYIKNTEPKTSIPYKYIYAKSPSKTFKAYITSNKEHFDSLKIQNYDALYKLYDKCKAKSFEYDEDTIKEINAIFNTPKHQLYQALPDPDQPFYQALPGPVKNADGLVYATLVHQTLYASTDSDTVPAASPVREADVLYSALDMDASGLTPQVHNYGNPKAAVKEAAAAAAAAANAQPPPLPARQ